MRHVCGVCEGPRGRGVLLCMVSAWSPGTAAQHRKTRAAPLPSSAPSLCVGPCALPPAGQRCSWTSTGRSPACSEATSSWCRWGMTSDTTSPRSGTPSSSTTSGSLTFSTANLTSTCRCGGAGGGTLSWGGGRPTVLQPGPCRRRRAPRSRLLGRVSLWCENSLPAPGLGVRWERVGCSDRRWGA